MSHYISADINNKTIVLTGGSSSGTIDTVLSSGFDIYGVYAAGEFDGGSSGTGAAIVNHKLATYAYAHAIAWNMAMEESFENKYHEVLSSIVKRDSSFVGYSFNDDLYFEYKICDLIDEMTEYHGYMSEEDVDTAFILFYGIISFTYKIYEYTKSGRDVLIYFA